MAIHLKTVELQPGKDLARKQAVQEDSPAQDHDGQSTYLPNPRADTCHDFDQRRVEAPADDWSATTPRGVLSDSGNQRPGVDHKRNPRGVTFGHLLDLKRIESLIGKAPAKCLKF